MSVGIEEQTLLRNVDDNMLTLLNGRNIRNGCVGSCVGGQSREACTEENFFHVLKFKKGGRKYFGQSYLNLFGFVREYAFLQTKCALSGKMDFLDEDADR